jgi:hypothetical protein
MPKHIRLRDALRREKRGGAPACHEMKLENLCVSPHSASVDGGGNVVYLTAKAKFMDTKTCALAVDVEKMKLQDMWFSLSVNGNEAQACLSPCQHFCCPQWLAI